MSEVPFVLGGSGFRQSELVKVTVTTRRVTATRRVRASGGGRFTVRFALSPMCGAFTARAVGDLGSRAAVRRLGSPCADG